MKNLKHIISFSGGKDSAAMLIRMIELGMKIDQILFCDTKKEFPQLYDYVHKMNKYTEEKIGVSVTWLTSKRTWNDWFFGKVTRGKMKGQIRGWPLMFFHCWHSRETKFKMMDPICEGHERYIGFATDEVKRVRAAKQKEGYNTPLDDWGWTEKDSLKYLDKKGMSEQFHHDFNRTGCFLCPKQPEVSLRTLCKKYPDQWNELMWYAKRGSNSFKPGFNFQKLKEIEMEETGCEI